MRLIDDSVFRVTCYFISWSAIAFGSLLQNEMSASPMQRAELVAQQEMGIVKRKTRDTSLGKVTSGKFRVFEDSIHRQGRTIDLGFKILHARSEKPKLDPVFFFAGGPGQASSSVSSRFGDSWIRDDRDLVFIDQRGTAGNHNLAFDFTMSGNSNQQYMGPAMSLEIVRPNLKRLSKLHNLTMYSTPIAMDDVNEFRKAIGYDKININGGSYGTRACLVYIRRHADTIRTATLQGCAPIEFRNPLHHSRSAQRALDMMFEEIKTTPKYKAVFGDLQAKFDEMLARFDGGRIEVAFKNRRSGESETVSLSRTEFIAAVRLQMYYTGNSRRLPKLLYDAHQGDFRSFVTSAIQQNRALRNALAMGMLLSVTAAEDLARIDENEIPEFTKDTYFGDGRIRMQLAACNIWPKSTLPKNFGEPVKSDVQTLVLSGLMDPVTPPKFGEMVHQNFPNSIHVVVPTAHDIGGSCVDRIYRQFLDEGVVDGLNVSCVESMELPPLILPVRKRN